MNRRPLLHPIRLLSRPQSTAWRDASRLRFIAALVAFGLAASVFLLSVWATLAPREFDRRVEWVQLKVQSLWPAPAHPEFVPTPIVAALEPTPAAAPTRVTTPAPVVPPATSLAPVAATPTRSPATRPARGAGALPERVALTDFRHEYQRFNNCGPATLAIDLSHFGRSETQYDLAPLLKGASDDRNVSPDELAALVRSYGLDVVVRVNGSAAQIKSLLAQGIPVMVESWFVPKPQDASGHYRLLIGYDDAGSTSTRTAGLSVGFDTGYAATEEGFWIAQDAYTGPNTRLPYRAWDLDWRVFNRTYLVIYTATQAAVVKSVVGDDWDDAAMYAHARDTARREVAAGPDDPFAWFNLGSSLSGLGQSKEAAQAFDKARLLKLPWRMMWYQFGPYEAYERAGRYAEVVALADATLAATPGLEESLYYRGRAQLALGHTDAARTSFQQALLANAHFARAKQALVELGGAGS